MPENTTRYGETYPKSDLFNKATRWTHHDDSGFIPYAITTGLDYEAMTEQRKGYENFVYQNGVYDLGTKGDMRRNERNLMWNLDPTFKRTGSSPQPWGWTPGRAIARYGLIPTIVML